MTTKNIMTTKYDGLPSLPPEIEIIEAARDLVHTRVRTEFSYFKAKQRLRYAIETLDNLK